ncbi:hypothetical protein AVEN_37347-1 [Araneus ventricosus]|uniref:Uncharacterized protein n=1 Tax=Araneus ventricosus TaxID=182803 RepID=A0A4Y2S9K1_ARAVE|nr:hypothetical protein AVEN_69484-1 [Araneus ventricosus]GBN83972.1 hypothetical protein AVEN_37347-1 [Araneus ventricosus]
MLLTALCLRNWNIPHATTPYIIHTGSNHHHMFVRSLVILLPHYLDFYGLETFSPDNSSSDYYPNLIFLNNNDKIKCKVLLEWLLQIAERIRERISGLCVLLAADVLLL